MREVTSIGLSSRNYHNLVNLFGFNCRLQTLKIQLNGFACNQLIDGLNERSIDRSEIIDNR